MPHATGAMLTLRDHGKSANHMVGDRVAFFLPSLGGGGGGPGGAERITLNLAGELAVRGYSVDMVLAYAGSDHHSAVPREVRVVDLKARAVSRSLPSLAAYLRRQKPAVLLSALDHGNVVAILARRLANVSTRVVVANHIQLSIATQQALNLRSRLIPLFVRHTYKMADAIVSVSRGAADDLARIVGIPSERIRVIYNPVLSPRFFETAKMPVEHPWFTTKTLPLIVSAGRLTRQKNFGLLLRAFSAVRSRSPARLVIFGEGEERPALQKLVQELGIGADVSLPGWTSNVAAFIARADVFVLSSLWEALPTVLVEALALGTPVVSTDCRSGPREILGDGKYGTLVPPEDFELLASAVESILKVPGQSCPKEALRPFEITVATDEYLKVLGLAPHA